MCGRTLHSHLEDELMNETKEAKLDTIYPKNCIHILRIDKDAFFLDVSKLVLMDMDNRFEIDNACSVDEALTKMKNKQYDVVVSDYEMPQKNGLQFLSELREQNNKIPFILFTGRRREEIDALNLEDISYFCKMGETETVYSELCQGIVNAVVHAKAILK